jgi:hypothetical protein
VSLNLTLNCCRDPLRFAPRYLILPPRTHNSVSKVEYSHSGHIPTRSKPLSHSRTPATRTGLIRPPSISQHQTLSSASRPSTSIQGQPRPCPLDTGNPATPPA